MNMHIETQEGGGGTHQKIPQLGFNYEEKKWGT